jgi:hypothetical protein
VADACVVSLVNSAGSKPAWALRGNYMFKVMAFCLLLGCALPFAAQGEVVLSTSGSAASVSKRLVSFYSQPVPSAGKLIPIRGPAVLSLPSNVTGPVPAVVILHGSAGMDSRGPLHAGDLNARGIQRLNSTCGVHVAS